MEALPNRIQSFSKTKRVKPDSGKSSAAVSVKWTHPSSFQANPTALAEAGFFFDPSYDERDNVTCFLCSKQLSDWTEEDDPFEIHWKKCKTTCAWAVVRCGLKYDMDDDGQFTFQKSRAPTSKSMEKARLETFIPGVWPHSDKSHGAAPKRMAQAGFVFTPQHAGDDLATCLYCNIALSGWEEGDDPLEEHRKRVDRSDSQCPFFHTQQTKKPVKAPAKTPAKPPSKAVPQSKTHPPSAEESEAEEPVVTQKKNTTRSKSRKATTSRAPDKEPDVIVPLRDSTPSDDDEVPLGKEVKAKLTRKSSARLRGKSKAVVKDSDDQQESEEPTSRRPKSTRSRSKSVVREKAPPEAEEEPPAPKKTSRQRGNKTKPPTSKAAPTRDEDELTPQPETVKELKTPRTVTKSHTRANSRMQTRDVTSANSQDPDPQPPRIVKGARSRSKPQSNINANDELPPPKSTRKPSSKAKPTASRRQYEDDVASDLDSHDDGPSTPSRERHVHEPAAEPVDGKQKTALRSKSNLPSAMVLDTPEESSEVDDADNAMVESPVNDPMEVVMEKEDVPDTVERGGIVDISTDDDGVLYHDASSDVAAVKGLRREENQEHLMKGVLTHSTGEKREGAASPPPLPPPTKKLAIPRTPPRQDAAMIVNGKAAATPPRSRETTVDSVDHDVTGTSLPFQPPLARLPIDKIASLTDAELDMTVEEWIRHEMSSQYAMFRADGQRMIRNFQEEAEEVRRAIEAM